MNRDNHGRFIKEPSSHWIFCFLVLIAIFFTLWMDLCIWNASPIPLAQPPLSQQIDEAQHESDIQYQDLLKIAQQQNALDESIEELKVELALAKRDLELQRKEVTANEIYQNKHSNRMGAGDNLRAHQPKMGDMADGPLVEGKSDNRQALRSAKLEDPKFHPRARQHFNFGKAFTDPTDEFNYQNRSEKP